VTTETVTRAGDAPPEVVERTTETTAEPSHGGVLSTTADFIGAVIAFPFRLVGAVVGAIF